MDTILMNSENSKTSDHHRLLINLSDIINLKRRDKYVALSLSIQIKISKRHTKLINLKHQLQNGMKSLNYLMDHISVSNIQDGFQYIFKKTWDNKFFSNKSIGHLLDILTKSFIFSKTFNSTFLYIKV